MTIIPTLRNHKGRVAKTTSAINYSKLILNSLVFYALGLNIIACSGGVITEKQEQPLLMQVDPGQLIEGQQTIEVRFSLNENIQRVLIDQFQLKVTLTPRESRDTKLLYTNAAGKQRSIPSTASNLSFFTEVSELSLEDEILSISFTLVPAAGINTVNIKFELLDEEGERIQTCNATWYNRASMHLTVIPHEESSIDIRVNASSINSKAGNSLAISNSTKTLNDPINFETPPFEEGAADPNTVMTRKRPRSSDKFIQPIKKFKEESETFARYESMDIRELAKLANSHNSHAQEEIIIRCLKQGVSPLLKKLITPFSWDEIQLKTLEDERYVFLLLRFLDQTKGSPLDTRIVRKVIADATAGGILAQCNLGFMYEHGQGVDRDDKQAFEWYSKSAYQGNAIAQNNLGNMYRDRRGVELDYKKAFEWFEKAAHQGSAQAQCSLGFMYSNGQGVDRDYKQAFEWYSKAAHQGDLNAQYNLGFMYKHGQGVDRDDKKAFEWFEKAAYQGNANAQSNLGLMYYNGQGVDRDGKQAFEWFEKAGHQGNALAQYNLGLMYYNGQGIDRDDKQAFEWFEKAAHQGKPNAQYNLGLMYYNGQGVDRDDKQAFEWYQKAAHQGYSIAQTILGNMYKQGQGVVKDLAQAIFWYKKAKQKQNVLSVLSVNNEASSVDTQINEEEINIIAELLIPRWQVMIVQKARDREHTHASLALDSYRQLEEIIIQLMGWQHELSKQSELMIGCLAFKDSNQLSEIETRQEETGVTPYVKQYMLQGKIYISFGEANVKLSDEIIQELTHKHIYAKAQNILKGLRATYKSAQIKAAAEASCMEEIIQRPGLTEIEKNTLLKKLERENELAMTFTNKLQEIEEEIEHFNTYYRLVIEQIEQRKHIRNNKFQQAHEYLFK